MANLPKFRCFTFFALFFLCGILSANFLKLDFYKNAVLLTVILFSLLLSSLVNFLLRNKFLVFASLLILGLILGIFYFSFFEFRQQTNLPFDQKQTITGQIIKKPDIDYKRQQVIIKTENLDGKPMLLVNLPHFPTVHYGDKITFEGKIEKPGKIEDFDYGRYLKKHLIFGIAKEPQNIQESGANLSITQKLVCKLYYISYRVEDALNWVLPEPHASLASGLILGIKRNIPEKFKENLSTTGLTHIIALSGYNVTILVAIFAGSLIGYLGKKNVLFLGILLILSFIVLTGASASVVRAGIFSLLILFGKTIGRRGDFTNIMLLAALVMVLLNPFVLYDDVGFQLSFFAFAGLIYLSPILEKYISNKKYSTHIPTIIKETLTATLAAQIAVLPIILVTFGKISLIAPISNLLILWIIPIAMAIVAISGFLTIIWYPLGKLASFLAWPVLQYIIKMVEWMAKIPGASINWQNASWYIVPISYIVLILAAIYSYRKLKLNI